MQWVKEIITKPGLSWGKERTNSYKLSSECYMMLHVHYGMHTPPSMHTHTPIIIIIIWNFVLERITLGLGDMAQWKSTFPACINSKFNPQHEEKDHFIPLGMEVRRKQNMCMQQAQSLKVSPISQKRHFINFTTAWSQWIFFNQFIFMSWLLPKRISKHMLFEDHKGAMERIWRLKGKIFPSTI